MCVCRPVSSAGRGTIATYHDRNAAEAPAKACRDSNPVSLDKDAIGDAVGVVEPLAFSLYK